jgi:hypothetical protein
MSGPNGRQRWFPDSPDLADSRRTSERRIGAIKLWYTRYELQRAGASLIFRSASMVVVPCFWHPTCPQPVAMGVMPIFPPAAEESGKPGVTWISRPDGV